MNTKSQNIAAGDVGKCDNLKFSKDGDKEWPNEPEYNSGNSSPTQMILNQEHGEPLNLEDPDDFNVMTTSYGEISNDDSDNPKSIESLQEYPEGFYSTSKGSENEFSKLRHLDIGKDSKRPTSLSLPSPASPGTHPEPESITDASELCAQIHLQTSDSQATSIEGSPSLSSEEIVSWSPTHRKSGSQTSGLSADLQGTLTYEGDMVGFVADDLQKMIQLSSPVTKKEDFGFEDTGASSSSQSQDKPSVISQVPPPIDPLVLDDLECHAKRIATCLDIMLGNLSGTLHSISSLTFDCMETYESAVCRTCDSLDANIKAMYQLIAKCEELSRTMGPMYKIADEIKEAKRLLDLFENIVEHKS